MSTTLDNYDPALIDNFLVETSFMYYRALSWFYLLIQD